MGLSVADSDITISGVESFPAQQQVSFKWILSDPHEDGGLFYLQCEQVEVWAASDNDASHAIHVADGLRDALVAGLSRGETLYFWFRPRDRSGNYGAQFPADPFDGIVATEISGDVLIAQDGYWKHPSGLIEQWGRADLAGGGPSTSIVFPLPFPNQCFNVTANPLASPSSTIVRAVNVETFDTDTVLLSANLIENGGTVAAPAITVMWQARGF